MTFIPVYFIFVPIFCGLMIYLFHNNHVNYLTFLGQTVISILAVKYYFFLRSYGDHELLMGGWHKSIGIALKNDMLSMLFIFLSIFMWWIVFIYEWQKEKEDYKYLFFLLFLEGSFLALLQTGDLFNLFVLFELITIISAILIIYKKDGFSIRSGLYYLLFNSIGMLFYLMGLILVYMVTGTLNMDTARDVLITIGDHRIIQIAYIFMVTAFGVKSAFFPVYNWLPKAHGAAPAAISALLSGLLVKSGLYGFIRVNQVFQVTFLQEFFFYVGMFTALSGVLFALSQKDIKQILAFHTVSQVGIILMGLSFMEGQFYYGGLLHLFNHAIFKSLLFMETGVIINHYDSRRVTEIRGVFHSLPYISVVMIIGMLSITGAPFFNGFISKSIIAYGLKEDLAFTMVFHVINLGTVTSFIKFSQIFFGKETIRHRVDLGGKASLGFLSLICILLGNFYNTAATILWNTEFSYIQVLSGAKWLGYIITLGIGFLLYRGIIDKDYGFIKKIRHTHISFQTANVLLITFVGLMLLWGRY